VTPERTEGGDRKNGSTTADIDDVDRILREAERVLASFHDALNESQEEIDATLRVLRRAGYLRR